MADVRTDRSLVRCLHCGVRGTQRTQLPSGSYHFACPSCGPFRIGAVTEAIVTEPAPASRQGLFVLDADRVRWLVVAKG